jgi:hypothetical protein
MRGLDNEDEINEERVIENILQKKWKAKIKEEDYNTINKNKMKVFVKNSGLLTLLTETCRNVE